MFDTDMLKPDVNFGTNWYDSKPTCSDVWEEYQSIEFDVTVSS